MSTTVVQQYFNKIVKHLETLKNEEYENILKAARDDKGTDQAG